VANESTEVDSHPVEAKCGRISTKMLSAKRHHLKSCLSRSTNATEHLCILEQIKDDNRFFMRLWDKASSGRNAYHFTTGLLCGSYGSHLNRS
jgi:hypothetical protein